MINFGLYAPEHYAWLQFPKSDFRVKTPTDVSSVRGTRFTVRYDARTQVSTTLVEEGVVQVTPTNPSLKPVTLRAGERVEVA